MVVCPILYLAIFVSLLFGLVLTIFVYINQLNNK